MGNSPNLEFRKIKSLKFLYEVNGNGTIFRNVKSKRQLKIKLDYHHSKAGYYVTFVHIGGRSEDSKIIRVMIHKVVAECWLGDCLEGMEVDHIDRNPHNNDYRNLRYVTKSEQMKNRDHSKISAIGSQNLAEARALRMKPVLVCCDSEWHRFDSFAGCARFFAQRYNEDSEKFRYRLKSHRSHIYDYDIIYLNAETGHGRPTGQGTVHVSDLTGNYTTAFNLGKQQEVEMRVKHTGTEV